MTGKDKRRAPRESHDSVLEFFDKSGKDIIGSARLHNVSTTGACFASTLDFKKGQTLMGRIRLFTEGVWDVTAHVRWRKSDQNAVLYGIQFDSVVKKKK
jgi:hypothetical protein